MKKVTCAILIDGLRHDYLNDKDAPFLCSLMKEGWDGIVKETFAFQLRPAFFAGLYPEECNIAHLYWYDPPNSPFKFTKYIPEMIMHIPKVKCHYKDFLIKIVRKIEAMKGNLASSYYATFSEIPYSYLRYFDFSEKYITWKKGALGKHVTLFDILRENNLRWIWIAYPTHDLTTEGVIGEFKESINNDWDFIYLHFAELDWAGHVRGPHSFETKKALRKIDIAIEEIFSILNKKYHGVNAVIFGDHGMVKINRVINLQTKLERTGLRVGKDYVYFLDSTQARFWFYREGTRAKIESLLTQSQGGRILTRKDMERLHFRFSHNRFGELIFMVDDNTLILPNFFQGKNPAKGMHGYLPEVKGNWGKLIVVGSDRKLKEDDPMEMTEIFPLVLHLLGLPVPDTYKGATTLR